MFSYLGIFVKLIGSDEIDGEDELNVVLLSLLHKPCDFL